MNSLMSGFDKKGIYLQGGGAASCIMIVVESGGCATFMNDRKFLTFLPEGGLYKGALYTAWGGTFYRRGGRGKGRFLSAFFNNTLINLKRS